MIFLHKLMPLFAVPGGKPVIGPVPGLPKTFFAAGHEGEGLSLVIFFKVH